MTICQYYQRGTCAFGDKCRFEHPGHVTAYNKNARSPTGGNRAQRQTPAFNAESINTDLTTDRPTWPLSSFGPAKNEPNLLDGLDVSPEELQLKFYEARQLNDPSKYPEAELLSSAESRVQHVLGNLKQACDHANNLHNQTFNTGSSANAFQSNTPSSAFGGTPSAFGNTGANTTTTSAFGKPSFGSSTFGSSAFGASSNNANSGNTSAFGAPAFGSGGTGPRAFGASAGGNTVSAFGAAATTPTTSAFGAFGSNTNTAPAYGTSAFGQPNTTAPASAFGASTFGQNPTAPTAPAFGTSTFGQAQNQTPQTSAFGQPANATSSAPAFGAPAFGQSTFGNVKPQQSAFGTSALGNAATQQPATAFSNASTGATGGGGFGSFGGAGNTGFGASSFPSASVSTANAAAGGFPSLPSGNNNNTAFGQSAFGASTAQATSNPFSSGPTNTQQSGWGAFSSAQPAAGAFGSAGGGGTGFSAQISDPYGSSAPQVSELSKDDMEAYESPEFSWERGWPSMEPPLALR